MYQFRNAKIEGLDELLTIENQGFSPEEAASKTSLIKRIEKINDTFIIADLNGKIAGYINGPVIDQSFITDDLFENINENPHTGGYVAILGLVVDQSQRNQGLAGKLLNEIEQRAKSQKRLGITLTCKEKLIPFYEKYGFINKGVSSSQHGGIKWFDLMKVFE